MNAPDTQAAEIEDKTIAGTLALGWGTMHDCTFCGALESALAATAHPVDYITLMGGSALAFRMRWWVGHLGFPMFCMSGPVGEMAQEHALLSRVTGWKMEVVCRFGPAKPMADQQQEIVRSIDAGLPVIVYHPNLDCAVVDGYRQQGHVLLVRNYYAGPDAVVTTADQLGPQITYLKDHQEAMSAADAAVLAIKMALSQWQRTDGGQQSEKGQYLFGRAAYAGWIDALSRARSLADGDRKMLFQVNWWTFSALVDARGAASRYLRNIVGLLPESAGRSVLAAAEVYEKAVEKMGQVFQSQDLFTGPWTGKTLNDWTADTRQHEQSLLHELLALDEQAIDLLRQAGVHNAPEAAGAIPAPAPAKADDPGCDAGTRGGAVRKPSRPVRIPPAKQE